MNVAIVGYGVEGHSSYEYWTKLGHVVTIHDAKPDLELPAGAKSVLGEHYLEGLDRYDLIVRTPGLMPYRIETKAPITTATREFFDHCPAPIIGVTGTKGKGTTVSFIESILREAGQTVWLGGNIGTPMLDFLPKVKPADVVVLELSSFQLIDLHKSPHVAVHLMMVEDHLDTHRDFAEYQAAKANIFSHQKPEDVAVFVATNTYAAQNVELSPAGTRRSVSIVPSVSADCYVRDNDIYFADQKIMSAREVHLLGRFNLENVCAAIAAVWDYVSDPAVISRGISAFRGLPHRMELVAAVNGVQFVDDAIAVNPEASLAAIGSFTDPVIAILGGKDKKMSYEAYCRDLAKIKPKQVIVMGEIADTLATGLRKHGYKHVVHVTDMHEAVVYAARQAKSGDVVLLAPGTSSFDMYKDFAAKGREFQDAVQALRGKQ